MNLENLKQASNTTAQKEKLTETRKKNCLEILNRFGAETDFIKSLIDQLVIDTSKSVKPNDWHGFEFYVVYQDGHKKHPYWQTKHLLSEAFWYVVEDNTITRICQYESLAIYDGHEHLLSNIVTIPDVSLALTDQDLDAFEEYLDNKWFERSFDAWKWWSTPQLFYQENGILWPFVKGYNIISHECKSYSSIGKFSGHIDCINLYPEGNKKGLEVLMKKELDDKINYDAKDEFVSAYRDKMLEVLKSADMDSFLEKALCEEMAEKDYRQKERLYMSFDMYYADPAYKLRVNKPNITLYNPGGNSLELKFNNHLRTWCDLPSIDVMDIEMSDTFWSHEEPESMLYHPSLSLNGFDLVFDDAEDWYKQIANIIKEKLESIGLTVYECEETMYEDDTWSVSVGIKNPVYEGDANV